MFGNGFLSHSVHILALYHWKWTIVLLRGYIKRDTNTHVSIAHTLYVQMHFIQQII